MTKRQKENVLETLGLSEARAEAHLDGLAPQDFKKFRGMGEQYVDYVRNIRDLPVVRTKESLLDPDTEDRLGVTEAPYTRQPTTYHPLDDGSVDVRLTLNFTVQQAHWMEDLERRLPEMYNEFPEMAELSWHIRRMVLETMKLDAERSGGVPGTMTREQFNGMQTQAHGQKVYT